MMDVFYKFVWFKDDGEDMFLCVLEISGEVFKMRLSKPFTNKRQVRGFGRGSPQLLVLTSAHALVQLGL